MKELFSGLNIFGFDKIEELPAFKTPPTPKKAKEQEKPAAKPLTAEECLFDKSLECPVCGKKFKEKAIRSSNVKFHGTDLDLMPIYTPIHPFMYNVFLCSTCGYAALNDNFNKITDRQCDNIKKNISEKFKAKKYTVPYKAPEAIERLKLALLNTMVKNGRASEKGYICLILSWLYKLSKDGKNRYLFVKNARDFFTEAYEKDTFPLYGMDQFVTAYLLGELSRLLGDYDSASKWVAIVLTSRTTTAKAKDMAVDLKERIKQGKAKTEG